MGIPNKRLRRGDLYVDYDSEDVMFRWDSKLQKFYRKFAGESKESEVKYDNSLLTDALLNGDEISLGKYESSSSNNE